MFKHFVVSCCVCACCFTYGAGEFDCNCDLISKISKRVSAEKDMAMKQCSFLKNPVVKAKSDAISKMRVLKNQIEALKIAINVNKFRLSNGEFFNNVSQIKLADKATNLESKKLTV